MFNALQSGATNEYHKLRTKRVSEILKNPTMSNDDFVFLDNFVKTYFPDASKALKNVLTSDALKKVFQGTQYKELEAQETVFTSQEVGKYYVLVISGKIDIVEENNPGPALKSFAKGEVSNPTEVQALAQPSKEIKAVTTEKSEVLMYEKDLYDSVIKEFASAATTSKLRGMSKHFMKIKKMDRSSKEEFLNSYFKTEKFTKGTVIVNIKSKVEEIYLIQSGKVVLCAPNDAVPAYSSKIVFGVLGPENIFNEIPLLFERPSPYYAVCLEDTEVLSLAKVNLNFVTDQDSLSDLRGNSQSRQRLQSTFIEKYQKNSKEEIEQSQKKICEKAGIIIKDLNDAFEKFDPKSKTSHQFAKNLERFNKTMEKPGVSSSFNKLSAGPLQKFSEFATPRLVSKDPNFRTLDPQRQLALLALRNEGANRRAGNAAVPKTLNQMNKDDIMKMQSRLLNEEKAECQKIMEKKSISEKANINAPAEEEKTSIDEKKGLFNKMKMGNNQLLAQLGVKETVAGEESVAANTLAHVSTSETSTAEPIKTETPEVKPVEPPVVTTKSTSEADEKGLKMTRGNLANLLGIGAGPNIKPQADIIAKKRTNLLKNFL